MPDIVTTLYWQDGDPMAGARVLARLNKTEVTGTGYTVPREVSAETDENGEATLSLHENETLSDGSHYRVTIRHPDVPQRLLTLKTVVPDVAGPLDLHDISEEICR